MASDVSFRFGIVRFPIRARRDAPPAPDTVRPPGATSFESAADASGQDGQRPSLTVTADAFVRSETYLPNTEQGRGLLARTAETKAAVLAAQPLPRELFKQALHDRLDVQADTDAALQLPDRIWSAFYAAMFARPMRMDDIARLQVWMRALHLLALSPEDYDRVAPRILDLPIEVAPTLLEAPPEAVLSGSIGARTQPQQPQPSGTDARVREIDNRIATFRGVMETLRAAVDRRFARYERKGKPVHASPKEGQTLTRPPDVRGAGGETVAPADSPWRLSPRDLGAGDRAIVASLGQAGLSLDAPVPTLTAALQHQIAELTAERHALQMRSRLVITREGFVVSRRETPAAD